MKNFFPLLLLPLLLAACALPVRDGMVLRAPQGSPTAALQGIGSGKGAQNTPQASPEPSRAIPSPTEGPDVLATLQTGILWATQTERAYERAVAAQTATQQALVNSFAFASQTAQKPASTATKAAQDAEATQQTAYITQSAFIVYATQNAPAQELAAENAKAQAGSATFRAWAQPIMQVGVGVGSLGIAIFLIGYVAASWKRQGAAVEAEPQEDADEPERTRPVFMDGATWITPPPPPGDYKIFLEWAKLALLNAPLSFDGMVGAGKLYRKHEDYRPLSLWAQRWRVTELIDGTRVLSDNGRTYCQEVVARVSASPTSAQDVTPDIAPAP